MSEETTPMNSGMELFVDKLVELDEMKKELDKAKQENKLLQEELTLLNKEKEDYKNKKNVFDSEDFIKTINELKEANAFLLEQLSTLQRTVYNLGEFQLNAEENVQDKLIQLQMEVEKVNSKKKVKTAKIASCIRSQTEQAIEDKNGTTITRDIQHFSVICFSAETDEVKNFSTEKTGVYIFNSQTGSWKQLSFDPKIIPNVGAAALVDDEIYIFGGGFTSSNKSHCYKLAFNGDWIKLAEMHDGRAFISNSSVVYQREIWVMGGWNLENKCLKSVEKYNPSTNQWTQMPYVHCCPKLRDFYSELNQERYDSAALIVDQKIFVSGGGTDAGNSLKSVEMFEPTLWKWVTFRDLPSPRQSHCMISYNDNVFIIGGQTEEGGKEPIFQQNMLAMRFNHELAYHSETAHWNSLNICKNRQRFGAVKLFDKLMIVGGVTSGRFYANETDIFDGNGWYQGPHTAFFPSLVYAPLSKKVEKNLLFRFS